MEDPNDADEHLRRINQAIKHYKEVKQRETSMPPNWMWNVVIYNDDFTPMEFVVDVLMQYFGHSEDEASAIMLDVHQKGKGIAGAFTFDIAETKAAIAEQEAEAASYPLHVGIEQAGSGHE